MTYTFLTTSDFITADYAWRGTLQQYAGRLHRLHDNKRVVRIYDYVDSEVPMLLRMYKKRLKGYTAIGYSVQTDETTPEAPPF